MDIQKDGDFEKAWQENRHIWESTKNLAKAMFYAGQAKAQAVSEGFVLVPKEPTQEMIQAGLENVRESWNDVPVEGFDSFTLGDMVSTWKDMIWAQEPAND